jgi:dTDP-4-dehydrorhamnose reductase
MAAVAHELGSRLVHISTDMVFSGKRGNYSEEDKPEPISYYGYSKRAAEEDVLNTYPEALVIRVALLYGFPLSGGVNFSAELYHHLRAGSRVKVFTDQFRTPIWAGNAAAAIAELAMKSDHGVLHLGGNERISRSRFAAELARQMDADPQLLEEISMHEIKWLVPRPQDVSLSSPRARQILQTPLLDCREGIEQMLAVAPPNL